MQIMLLVILFMVIGDTFYGIGEIESQEVLAIGYDLDYHRQHKLEMQES